MSSNVELYVGAVLDPKAIKEIQSQIEAIGKGIDGIKIDIKADGIKDIEKSIDRITKEIKTVSSHQVRVFDSKELEKSGRQFKYITRGIEETAKNIESSYKKIGDTRITNQSFDVKTGEMKSFAVEAKNANGEMKKFHYTLQEMDNGKRFFLLDSIKGSDEALSKVTQRQKEMIQNQKEAHNLAIQYAKVQERISKIQDEGAKKLVQEKFDKADDKRRLSEEYIPLAHAGQDLFSEQKADLAAINRLVTQREIHEKSVANAVKDTEKQQKEQLRSQKEQVALQQKLQGYESRLDKVRSSSEELVHSNSEYKSMLDITKQLESQYANMAQNAHKMSDVDISRFNMQLKDQEDRLKRVASLESQLAQNRGRMSDFGARTDKLKSNISQLDTNSQAYKEAQQALERLNTIQKDYNNNLSKVTGTDLKNLTTEFKTVERAVEGAVKAQKEQEQIMRKIGNTKMFDGGKMEQIGVEFHKISGSANDAMKDIEKLYSSMGKTKLTGQSFDAVTGQVKDFGVQVETANGEVKTFSYTMGQLEGTGERVFVKDNVTGYTKAIKDAEQSTEQLLKKQTQLSRIGKNIDNMEFKAAGLKDIEGYDRLAEKIENVKRLQQELNQDVSNMSTEDKARLDKMYAEAQRELDGLVRKQKEFNAAQKEAQQDLRTEGKFSDMGTKIFKMQDSLKDLDGARLKSGALEQQVNALATAYEELGKKIQKGTAKPEDFTNLEQSVKSTSNAMKEAEIAQARFNKENNKLEGIQRVSSGVEQAGRAMMGLTAPIMAAASASFNAAKDYESAFAGVRKTTEATETEFRVLSKGFLEMSEVLPQSASAIAEVGEVAGQLGIHQENMLDFTKTMIMLGDATNLASDEAADNLARFANIMGMSPDNYERLGSAVVDLGNNLATTEKEIVGMGMRLAGVGNQLNLSEADVMGLAGAMSSLGVKVESGGSAMSKFLSNMSLAVEGDSKKAKESLEGFAKVAGVTSAEFKKIFRADAMDGLVLFINGLQDIEAQGGSVIKTLDGLGISEIRMRDALLRLVGGGDLLEESLKRGNKAWGENIALQNEANERYQTTESRMAMVKNQIQNTARAIGEDLAPMFLDLVEALLKVVKALTQIDPAIQQFIIKGSALMFAIAAIANAAGKLGRAFSEIGMGIQMLGGLKGVGGLASAATDAEKASHGFSILSGIIQGLGSAFLGLPMPVKVAMAAVVAFAAIYRSNMKATEKASEEARKKRVDFLKTFEKNHKQDTETVETMEKIKDKYDTLNALVRENGDLSLMNNEQQKEYLALVQELKSIYPDFETKYNAEGQEIAASSESLERHIQLKKEEIKLNAQLAAAESRKEMTERDKERNAEKKREIELLERKTELEQQIEDKQDGDIKLFGRALEKRQEELNSINQELQEIHDNGVKDVAMFKELSSASLTALISDFEQLKPNVQFLTSELAKIYEKDPTKGQGALDGLEKSLQEAERVLGETGRLDTAFINKVSAELGKLGFNINDITSEFARMSMEARLSKEELAGVDKALKLAFKENKPEEALAELRKHFKDLPEDLKEFNKDTFQALIDSGNEDIAQYFATQIEMVGGYSEALKEAFKSIDIGDLSTQTSEGYSQITQLYHEQSSAQRAAIEEDAETKKALIKVLADELGLLSTEQANELTQQIDSDKEKLLASIDKQTEGAIRKYKEQFEKTSKALQNFKQKLSEHDDPMSAFDSLSGEDKQVVIEYIAEVRGESVDEVNKHLEEILENWDGKESIMTFIARELHIRETMENTEELNSIWSGLTPEEKKFIAKEVGIKDVEEADKQTMDTWLERPDVKRYLAEHHGLVEVGEKDKEVTTEWNKTPKLKTFEAKVSGYYAALEQIKTLKKHADEFNKGTYTVAGNNARLSNPQYSTGGRNVEGGYAKVGEMGRELMVYPDGSYDLTADQTEVRWIPKGTDIYHNSDTEKILRGQRQPDIMKKKTKRARLDGFAKGTKKAKSTKSKDKPNTLDHMDALVRFIQIQNDGLENTIRLLGRQYELAKRIEGIQGLNREHEIINNQIKQNIKLIKTFKKEQNDVAWEAKQIKKANKGWNIDKWYDANAEQSLYYIRQYNAASAKQQKKMEETFTHVQKLKKAWLEANKEIEKTQWANEDLRHELTKMDDRLREYAKSVIELEKKRAEADLEERRRRSEEMLRAEKEAMEARVKDIEAANDGLQDEIDLINEKERLLQKNRKDEEYRKRIAELRAKWLAAQGKNLENLTKEEAKELGLLAEWEAYHKREKDHAEDMIKLEELRQKLIEVQKNKKIKQLTKQEDGTWQFEYVADQKEINKVLDDIQNLQDKMTDADEDYRDKLIGLEEDYYEQLKKAEEDYNEWLRLERQKEQVDALQQQIKDNNDKIKEEQDTYKELEDHTKEYYDTEKENLNRYYHDIDALTDEWMQELKDTYDDNFYQIAGVLREHFNGIESDYDALVKKLMQPLPMPDKTPHKYIDPTEFENTRDKVFNLGYGGDTTKAQEKANKKKLKDEAYGKSEVNRTLEVIAHRKSLGLSTKDQEAYLKRLRKMGYLRGGETSETGVHWLDGTPKKPERVLTSKQTESFNKLVDMLPLLLNNPALNGEIAKSILPPNIDRLLSDNKELANQIFQIDKLEFPNVSDADEVREALERLPQHVERWIEKR